MESPKLSFRKAFIEASKQVRVFLAWDTFDCRAIIVFIVSGWCREPQHKLNFCFPPDWWLFRSEVPGAGLLKRGTRKLMLAQNSWEKSKGRTSLSRDALVKCISALTLMMPSIL